MGYEGVWTYMKEYEEEFGGMEWRSMKMYEAMWMCMKVNDGVQS